MKVIEGFEAARTALSREIPDQTYPLSSGLRQSLKTLFDVEEPEAAVRIIINDVRKKGDAALIDLTGRIDKIEIASLEVDKAEVAAAYSKVNAGLVTALKLAATRIRAFHAAQKEKVWHEFSLDGLGQLIRPLRRVGVYAPGGTAAYPSTVLMTAVPASVAGVGEIILATPPSASGALPAATLVAADIAGVSRIFRIGGAQAIAALAYGTESVPRVDKICGPGNIFVTLAKKLVYGTVAIDGLAGPSEVVVIADGTTDPAYCAADLLAQAEHDALSRAILITTSSRVADKVLEEVERQLKALSRRTIATASLERAIVAIVGTMDEAINLSNLYAPEHLCLMIRDAASYVDKIRNAGCVVLGRQATVVLGDYISGPSHVLPTGGTARFSSPLNVTDFLKYINTITVTRDSLRQLGKEASVIARAEGLDAHARAVERRLQD